MSQEDFADALRKLTIEPNFADRLKNDPDTALAGYSLSSAELKTLKEVDLAQAEMIVNAVSRRINPMASTNACVG